jgi:magnesium-transporting ATPase (P-type)
MKRKRKTAFFSLLILAVLFGFYWIYKFSMWYTQVLGTIFSYLIMLAIAFAVFYPFKLMKDKNANINPISYLRYLSTSAMSLVWLAVLFCKEAINTVFYIISNIITHKPKKPKNIEVSKIKD